MTAPPAPRALLASPALRFLVVGGANTALGYALFRALLHGLGARPHAVALAQATAYVIGVGVAFFANRRWTFRSSGTAGRELPRFLAAHLGALTLSSLLMQAGVARLGLPVALCFVLVTGVTTVLNFTTQRFWVFAAR